MRFNNRQKMIQARKEIGATICRPHRCICGTSVNQFGLHGLSCQQSARLHSRHTELNNIICQASHFYQRTTRNVPQQRKRSWWSDTNTMVKRKMPCVEHDLQRHFRRFIRAFVTNWSWKTGWNGIGMEKREIKINQRAQLLL